MIERWTIDSLAGEIDSQVKTGTPSPKLLRRFYREGLRDGRKAIPHEPYQDLLVDAVDLATSKLMEDFEAAEDALRAAGAADAARRSMLEDELSDPLEDVPPDVVADVVAPDLKAAFEALRARRAGARRAEREALRDQQEDEVRSLGERLVRGEQQLKDLPGQYRALVESCRETGELLWARYRTGYAQGSARRGQPTDDAPPADITFDEPAVLSDGQGGVS